MIAEKHLDIPRMLNVEDMVNNVIPDELWQTRNLKGKMATPIFKCQWTGQGAQKDSPSCSWAPDWGRGPDPDTESDY